MGTNVFNQYDLHHGPIGSEGMYNETSQPPEPYFGWGPSCRGRIWSPNIWGPSLLGAEFVRGRVCQGPSLLGAEMSRNQIKKTNLTGSNRHKKGVSGPSPRSLYGFLLNEMIFRLKCQTIVS